MKPTEILMSEHRNIEIVLNGLEHACDTPKTGEFPGEMFEECIEFIREYADKRHHGKEEARLFPKLVACGMPEDMGPIGCMKKEHELGRALVRKMAAALIAAQGGDLKARGDLILHAREFISLLRDHIQKEDKVLFNMADSMIPEAEQTALAEEFLRFDNEEIGPEALAKYAGFAENLDSKPVP